MGGIASDRFDPRSAEEFVHLGWTVHDGGRTCRLHYDLGGRRLTETVELSAAVDESE